MPSGTTRPEATDFIAGGQLTLEATYDKSGVGSATNTTTVYVTGIPSSQRSPGIPYGTISTELTKLYEKVTAPSGANFTPVTSGLMTQVAEVESGGQQFLNPPFNDSAQNGNSSYYPYGVFDYWPLEAPAGSGAHIGLMQVPVSQANAWNWTQNATNAIVCPMEKIKGCYKFSDADGGASFQEKLAIAYSNMVNMQEGLTPALGPLTSCQLEEMALALYGPSAAGTDITSQYYIPTCNGEPVNSSGESCGLTDWQWTVNTITTTKPYCGVCYVANVRTSYLPGDNGTLCSATDPPTTTLTQCAANDCPTVFVP